MKDAHFDKIFWFIVGLCTYGASLTIFLIIYLPAEAAQRVADTALIFWLSTAVSGGIGYLIGNSAKNVGKTTPDGTTTADISISTSTTNEPKDDKG